MWISNFMASTHREEKRLQCMKDWNIIDENGNPTPPVVNAASKLHSLTADFLQTVPEQVLPIDFDVREVNKKILRAGGGKSTEDMHAMINIAVTYGNDLEKIASHPASAVRTEINRLKTKYGLVAEATSPTSITLERICLLMPEYTCHYLTSAQNDVVNKKALLSMCSDYPIVMTHEAFGTLIPHSVSEECQRIIIDAHCVYQAHHWANIGRSRGESNKKPVDYIGS